MSVNKFESVSSLVDLESTDSDVVDEMLTDQAMADCWQRYHLVGDVMRGDAPETISVDLSANVMAAIADEPTVLAPNTEPETQTFKAKVVQLFKPVGQVAIAASAAGLMIMGVQQVNVAENDPVMQNNVFQTTPINGVASPVSLNYDSQTRDKQRQAFIEQQRRIQALLSDHNQQIKQHAVDSANAEEEQQSSEEDVNSNQ